MTDTPAKTELETLVTGGAAAQDAVDLGDGVFMSRGVSNCYQVVTDDGVLMVNTGLPGEVPATRDRFARAIGAPVRVIVITQGHNDHFGGWHAFAGPGVDTVVQADHATVRGYWNRLAEFYGRRTAVLWGALMASMADREPPPLVEVEPTTMFDDHLALVVGSRPVELLAVPGGETTDSAAVWLPDSKVVFTGNLFGPILGHVPNLYTIRGDKLRSALAYAESVERVRALGAEVLVTGHGDPLRGADQIDEMLTKLRDATLWLHDATVAGMNAGVDVHTLMRELTPPAGLRLGEGHGTVRWNVRAVWEYYSGWFHYDSTTPLYGVPQSAVAGDLVDLAGADALVARAAEHLGAGRPLEALHLVDVVLADQPDHRGASRVSLAAHELLLERSGQENLSETRWLVDRIDGARAMLQED